MSGAASIQCAANPPMAATPLPKGTPVAQCIPVKRENWVVQTAPFTDEQTQRAHDLTNAIYRETGVYRRQFRA